MNALKPRKGFVQDELNIERLTPIQWDGIMRAMQNYAKHYHETMQANDFEKPQEQCTIPDVSNFVLLAKTNYKAKDGTIKRGIKINGKYYAPLNDC